MSYLQNLPSIFNITGFLRHELSRPKQCLQICLTPLLNIYTPDIYLSVCLKHRLRTELQERADHYIVLGMIMHESKNLKGLLEWRQIACLFIYNDQGLVSDWPGTRACPLRWTIMWDVCYFFSIEIAMGLWRCHRPVRTSFNKTCLRVQRGGVLGCRIYGHVSISNVTARYSTWSVSQKRSDSYCGVS